MVFCSSVPTEGAAKTEFNSCFFSLLAAALGCAVRVMDGCKCRFQIIFISVWFLCIPLAVSSIPGHSRRAPGFQAGFGVGIRGMREGAGNAERAEVWQGMCQGGKSGGTFDKNAQPWQCQVPAPHKPFLNLLNFVFLNFLCVISHGDTAHFKHSVV